MATKLKIVAGIKYVLILILRRVSFLPASYDVPVLILQLGNFRQGFSRGKKAQLISIWLRFGFALR
jgi:hypothetical protein